ncbi:hypothetical protein HPB50_010769 [Hyalomma asiaticum]|uniref:Uncharacterized protein n=1 Tax=Hyalomma asiaticum TaxID=266040 RepID=A0ACB7T958_HYAAI|nr:hypothetical protein HPB50_010769 [Hyalomma asiaticum]
MVSQMFEWRRATAEACKTSSKADGRFVTMKPRAPTVAARFHDSLQSLMEAMAQCNPWFVRCIKPNNEKAPMKFDLAVVLEQLRYSGMLDTIRIRKLGYPIRFKFAAFSERSTALRYSTIWSSAIVDAVLDVLVVVVSEREPFRRSRSSSRRRPGASGGPEDVDSVRALYVSINTVSSM